MSCDRAAAPQRDMRDISKEKACFEGGGGYEESRGRGSIEAAPLCGHCLQGHSERCMGLCQAFAGPPRTNPLTKHAVSETEQQRGGGGVFTTEPPGSTNAERVVFRNISSRAMHCLGRAGRVPHPLCLESELVATNRTTVGCLPGILAEVACERGATRIPTT